MTRSLQVAVIASAVVLGAVIEWHFLEYERWYIVALDAIETAIYILVGVLLWSRRPDDRTGPLLVLTGFLFVISGIWALGTPILVTIGLWTMGWADVLRFHVLFGFPGGRITRRVEMIALGAGYLLVIAHGFWLAFSAQSAPAVGFQGVVLFRPGAEFYELNIYFRTWASVVLLLVGMGILVAKWVKGSHAYRRVMGPVLLAGVIPGEIIFLFTWSAAYVPESFPFRVPDLGLAGLVIMYVSEILVPVALAYGILRTRMTRGTVGDLVVDLGRGVSPGGLRGALARTLRDPSLVLAYPSSASTWIDESGTPVDLPPRASRRAVTVLEGDGGPVAALIHDPALLAEPELIEAVGAAARLALENERLHAEVLAQLVEVRASRARIVETGDVERRRVERDLHDGAQQRLVMLALALRQAQEQASRDDPRVVATLDEAAGELHKALAELRELARGIHPAILTEEGLVAAVEALAGRSPVRTVVAGEDVGRLSPPVEATAYFVASEALANVAKHAHASSAQVSISQSDGCLRIEVSDDGVGGADGARGSGLRGLEDRVAALGGSLTLTSPPGAGTRVSVVLPCA